MPDTSQAGQPVSAAVPSDAEWHVDKGLPRALARILALDDFEEPARRYLPRPMFGYVSGGAETKQHRRNIAQVKSAVATVCPGSRARTTFSCSTH